ncbi:MAG TPA: VWA domain-containing protein [Acidobacteriaceae bacterium]
MPAADSHAQSQQAPDQNHPELSHRPPPNPGVSEGKIKLDVLVTDGSGNAIAGLQQGDFTLLDNKKPQPILSFRAVDGITGNGTAADPPVEIILLIDMANNLLHNVAYERYQIDKFLKQNGGKLAQPVSLMVLSDLGVKAQPQPSVDGNWLAAGLDRLETSIHTIPVAGGYDAIERMDLSLRALRRIAATEGQKPGRKMLIWIGPGWPMLENPSYIDSEKVRRNRFSAIVELTRQLREARMTLYSIDAIDPGSPAQLRSDYYKNFLKGVKSASQAESGALSVPVFAVHTGGRVYHSSGDLTTLLNGCVAEAKAYYIVGFDPPAAEHVDEYHELAVRLDKPGMTAHTNTGYYAEPAFKP